MELKEAIDTLKMLKQNLDFAVDIEAIDTVLQALEELQKENEGLRKLSDHYQNLINYKYIQKDKIKEEIKKLNSYIERWKAEEEKPKEQCNKEIMRLTAQIGTLELLLLESEELNESRR